MKIDIITRELFLKKLDLNKRDFHANYFAMYSTWLDGITTDPMLMNVPIDDHLVHRGDGIFEALKVSAGRIYLFKEHLDRLEVSAKMVSLNLPLSRSNLELAIIKTVRAAQNSDCGIRIFVSRGPGGFGPSPYESVASQLYVVVTRLKPFDPEKYKKGAIVGISQVPMKEAFQATVKSCNYLNNVLMKKEAVDKGWDFPINISPEGFLGEGATENIGFVSAHGELLIPSFKYTLKGTTLVRLLELAQKLVAGGKLKAIKEVDITFEQAALCKEAMMFGTTIGVVPVVQINGKILSDGKPGPLARELLQMHEADLMNGASVN